MKSISFVEITAENVSREGLFCVRNPKNAGFGLKADWMNKRREQGLKLKLLKVNNETVGFIEYIPGEYAWRPVSAENFMFIHCIWVYPGKNLNLGYGSLLVSQCVEDARKTGKAGVAVMATNGTWMPDSTLFLKNGFVCVESKERFDLMVLKFNNSPDPKFYDWEKNALSYQGLNLVYANQCPLFIRSVEELKKTASEFELELNVTELASSAEAQQAPSGFGVYSLVYNGKILADHYISNTRFKNILNKEVKPL